MITCAQCTTVNIPNTLFCDRCGADLRPGATPPVAPAAAGASIQRQMPSLVCLLVDSRQVIPLPARTRITIGRADSANGLLPDLDLAPYNGAKAGVSREHARLKRNDFGLLLEDLGSMNGTFINDKRLPPNQPVSLPQGATVRVGKLRLRFEFRDD